VIVKEVSGRFAGRTGRLKRPTKEGGYEASKAIWENERDQYCSRSKRRVNMATLEGVVQPRTQEGLGEGEQMLAGAIDPKVSQRGSRGTGKGTGSFTKGRCRDRNQGQGQGQGKKRK
jgi:hypothetical protein